MGLIQTTFFGAGQEQNIAYYLFFSLVRRLSSSQYKSKVMCISNIPSHTHTAAHSAHAHIYITYHFDIYQIV